MEDQTKTSIGHDMGLSQAIEDKAIAAAKAAYLGNTEIANALKQACERILGREATDEDLCLALSAFNIGALHIHLIESRK